MLNIIYMGTPDFAVAPLKNLIKNHNVIAVISQPDREKNRKGILLHTPVKEFAQQNGIKVYQFNKISREGAEILSSLNADLFITCAYGQILSKQILDIPKYGTFNIHASLLPAYRGAAPVQWSLINGEKTTGITIMRTDIGVDTGDIILKNPIDILENETSGELLHRLSVLGAESILQALEQLENGTITYTKQDSEKASHFPMLKKTDGKIDFSLSAVQINNRIRGLNPAPGCYCYYGDIVIKVWSAEVIENDFDCPIGQVVISDIKKGLVVKCGEGLLRLKTIQTAGGKSVADTEFLKGNVIPLGTVLS